MKIRDASEYEGVDVSFALQGGERALQEGRALRQTNLELVGKGLGNIAENVIFETLKFPGTIASGIGIVTGNEGMVNNLWLQGFDALQKPLTELTEVYVPPSVQEKGLWGQLSSPYFWAGEGADAIGTMLSMMIPGRWLATFGLGAKAAKGLAKVGKLGEIAVDGSRILETTGDANKIGKFLVKTLGSTGRGLDFGKLARNIDSGVAVATNTLLESSAEALDTYESLLAQGKTPEEAGEAATKVMMLNMGLLTVSNTLLEKYVFNGFNRLPSVGKQLTTALKGGTPVFKPFQQAGIKFAAGVLAEGVIEEGLQTSFQQEEGDPIRSLERYFENFQSLFSADPDIEFGKAVILGSLLGGAVGGISGFSDVREQRATLEGRPERVLAKGRLGTLQGMLGYKAKQAEKGLIDIFRPSFESLKTGKDILKNSVNEKGEFNVEALKDDSIMFALSNMVDDILLQNNGDVQASKTQVAASLSELGMSNAAIKSLVNGLIPSDINNLSGEQVLKLITLKKDNTYFSRFAANPAGFEMLDAHIDDMVDALEERYEMNTGAKLSDEKKKSISTDLKSKAKRYKNMYEAATTFNNNVRYGIEVAQEDAEDFNEFIRMTQGQTLGSMTYIEELRTIADEIEKETNAEQQKINTAKSTLENAKKDGDPDLIKSREQDLAKAISDANAAVPNFNDKRKDLARIRENVAAREKNIIEFGTEPKVREKWEAFLEVKREKKKATQQYFDGVEVDTKIMPAIYKIIYDQLVNKGYTPELITDIPFVKIAVFHATYEGDLYTFTQTKDGFNVRNHSEQSDETVANWKALIEKFPKLTILTVDQYNLEKQRIDKEIADRKAELEQQAAIEALTQLSIELRQEFNKIEASLQSDYNTLQGVKEELAKAKKRLKSVQAKLRRDSKKGIPVGELQDTVTELKTLVKQLEAQQENTIRTIANLENVRIRLQSELNGIASLINRIQSGQPVQFTKEALRQAATTEVGLATGEFLTETLDFLETKNAEKTKSAFLEKFADYQVRLERQMMSVSNELTLAVQLSDEVRDLINLITEYISEVEASPAVKSLSEIPDDVKAELESKFPGVLNAMDKALKSNNPDVVLRFLANLVNKVKDQHSETYVEVLKDFAKLLQPYVNLSAEISSDVLSNRAQELVDMIDKNDTYVKGLQALRRFSVLIKYQRQLSKLKNQILKGYSPKEDPQIIPDVETQDVTGDPTLFSSEEQNRKVLSLFNTSGLNIEYDNDGNDVRADILNLGYTLPVPSQSDITRNFFQWLDSSDTGNFKVIPYAPEFNDTDFDDITDPETAKVLRDYIAGTPPDARAEALYGVVIEEVDGARMLKMYNGKPLINSMMRPQTKFPSNRNPRMARRAYIGLFLKDVLGWTSIPSDKDLVNTNNYNLIKSSIDKLEKYGISIPDPKSLTSRSFYHMIESFALVYTQMKYQQGFNELLSKTRELKGSDLSSRKLLETTGISKGFQVVAKTINGEPVQFDSENMELEYTPAGNPKNFDVLKANFDGVATLNGVKYDALQPGRLYIKKHDSNTLIPVEMGMLSNNEIDAILYMLSMYADNKRSLRQMIPQLDGSVRIKNTYIKLSNMSILPATKDRVSLISMIMNWGFKVKGDPSPFDIYLSKGSVIFNDSSISLNALKKAYLENDAATLQPLIAFLRTKRVNANYNLLSVANNFFEFTVERDKKTKKPFDIKAVQKQGSYAKHILDRASFYGAPKDVLDAAGLPSSAQKYIMFKDFDTKVDVNEFRAKAPSPKPKPVFTLKPSGVSPVINALRESSSITDFRTRAASYLTDPESVGLFSRILKKLENESGPLFEAEKLLVLNDKSIVSSKTTADVTPEESSVTVKDILSSLEQEETQQGEEGGTNITMKEALSTLWEQVGGKPETQEQPEAGVTEQESQPPVEETKPDFKTIEPDFSKVSVSLDISSIDDTDFLAIFKEINSDGFGKFASQSDEWMTRYQKNNVNSLFITANGFVSMENISNDSIAPGKTFNFQGTVSNTLNERLRRKYLSVTKDPTYKLAIEEARKQTEALINKPSTEPTPTNIVDVSKIDIRTYKPVVGDVIEMEGKDYTVVSVSKTVSLKSGTETKVLRVSAFRPGLDSNTMKLKSRVVKSVADYNKILSDAIQRGIIDEINCNR
jgi:sulfur relay (sulfurtransferase) DsrC/TusE family protein